MSELICCACWSETHVEAIGDALLRREAIPYVLMDPTGDYMDPLGDYHQCGECGAITPAATRHRDAYMRRVWGLRRPIRLPDPEAD